MKLICRLALIGAIAAGCAFNAASAKSAILVTHYGSSDSGTRSKTIDRITSDIQSAFPEYRVAEAYISPIVRKNLAASGINVDSPSEALAKLRGEGIDTVYVQSTTLIDGTEMAEVRSACEVATKDFKLVKCGESLCYSPADCEEVIEALVSYPCAEDELIVYVGHGNLLPSTATYSQLDLMFKAMRHSSYYMSTIEGYPTVGATAELLKSFGKRKTLTLIPFLLVCGNHTKKDIAGEVAKYLNNSGFRTEVKMQGLGENPQIRQLYVERVRRLVRSSK